MFPVLYKKDETDFVHNSLGVLSGAITAVPEEELNGPFEITIEYGSEGFLANKIENGMIVKAKANDRQDPQLFRIYAIEKSLQGDNLIIHGQHITYDLAGNFVERLILNNATTREAMEAIKANLAYPTRFNITSTNNETTSSTSLYRTNPLQMIGGMEGSILQHWGGQIERDNFNLIMHKRRGSDDGVLVTYKKNLTGLEAKFDESNVVTRIFPFKYDEETNTLITIDGKYIDSPNIDKYPVIKILPVDFSDDESITNKTDLYNASKDFFNTGGKDLPTVEMDVEFEPLYATEEYKDVAVLELVGMGDTITVRHSKMGIDVKAQVVKIEYDSLAEKNKKVSIGNVKARLTDTVNNATDIVNNIGEKINNANEKANQAIEAANGKNKIYYGPDEPTGNLNVGDIWFKTVDGEYTRTYRFDGVQWQLVVSADIRDIEEEAQEARNRADEAVAKANLATNNANEAIEQAQAAFDEATNAHTIADAAKQASEAAGRVAGEAYEQASTALTDARQAMTDAQSALTEIDDLQTFVNVEFQTINGQLSSKIGQTEFNGLKGTVESHTTLIQQNANSISLKADKTYVDTVKGTVDSHSTLIQQNAEEIKSKASQSSVDTISGKVTSHESLISQNAKEIATKISTVDANAKFATQSQLTQASDRLTSQITQVQTDLDNLELGGRNLLIDSSYFDNWIIRNAGLSSVSGTNEVKSFNSIEFYTGGSNGVSIISDFTAVEYGETVSAQAKVERLAGEQDSFILGVLAYDKNKNLIEEEVLTITAFASGANRVNYVPSYKGLLIYGDNAPNHLWGTFTISDSRVAFIRVRAGVYRGQASYTAKVKVSNVKLEKGNKISDWSPAIEDMVTNFQFSRLEQTVDSISTQVTSKVDKTVYDSFVQQTAQSLSSKVSQGDYDSNNRLVNERFSSITQTVQGIQAKVQDNEGNISSVTQLANALQNRMTNAEGSISTLTQTASSLQSTITSVRNDLDGLEIGDVNLVRNGNFSNDMEGWTVSYNSTVTNSNGGKYIRNNADKFVGIRTPKSISVEEGKEYTVVMEVSRAGNIPPPYELDYVYVMYDMTGVSNQRIKLEYMASTGGEYRVIKGTFTATTTASGLDLLIAHQPSLPTRPDLFHGFYIKWVKLVEGNMASRAWSPAIEDMATQSQISQLSDAINLRVTKKDLINQINIDTSGILISGKKLVLDGDTTVTGTFKVNNANIVSVDAGKMTAGILDAGKVSIVNLRGLDIYGSKFRSSDGLTNLEIVGGNVRLTQSNGNYVNVNPNGLFGYNSNGSLRFKADETHVLSSAVGTSNANVYLGVRDGYEARVVVNDDIPGDGLVSSYRYMRLRASGIMANYLNVNPHVPGGATNIYLRPLSNGEVRVTLNETTSNYQNLRADGIYGNWIENNSLHGTSDHIYVRPRSAGEVRITAAQSTTSYRSLRAQGLYATFLDLSSHDTAASHIYVRPAGDPGELRVTVRDTTGTYRPVRALDYLPPSSTRETKKHIEVYKESVLDTFRNTSVYTFLYKQEEDNSKKRLGVMLDEVPSIIHASTGDTIEMYSTVGYLFKGVKDLVSVTDDLRNTDEELILKVAKLEERINKLEAA